MDSAARVIESSERKCVVRTRSVLKSILHIPATGVLPRDLLTTDRIMQRWASGAGDGLPTERWDDSRVSRPPPLDDDTWLVVERIVQKLPDHRKRRVIGWYIRPLPTSVLAEELRMSARGLEKCVHIELHFLKFKFETVKNLTLDRLLLLRIP